MKLVEKLGVALFREHRRILVSCLALLFCTAPVPGDVGGCGQKPAELDAEIFFASKANIDCQRCQACGLQRAACTTACQFPERYPQAFPAQCLPFVHDGEVCLRALQSASCSDYGSYMSDTSPTVPSECNFCPGSPP